MTPVDRIAVGNLGTKPVRTYSSTIGIARITEINASTPAMTPKNWNGRSCLYSARISRRILIPSL